MPLNEAQLKEVDRLRKEHPDYTINKVKWEFLLEAYEGGPEYVTEHNLFKHQREPKEDYLDRLTRAVYANYSQPLVDFVPEFIYSQGVQRTAPKEMQKDFDTFKLDVDRAGTAIDPFMEVVAEDARIFGHTWVGLDKKEVPEEFQGQPLSLAKAEELDVLVPYFYHVRPLEILDWVTDRYGDYLYVKRKEIFWEKKGSASFINVERYTEWYPDRVVISRIDITDPGDIKLLRKVTRVNEWQLIPFVQFFYKKSKTNKDLGVSFLNDLAYQNRSVFNLNSLLDEFLYRQCFNILVMETNSVVPTRDRVDGRVGTSNVLWIPHDAKHKPEYVSPPVQPAEFIQSQCSKLIKEMYRQAAQDIMAEVFAGSSVPSAESQKQAFSRTIPMIAKMADMMQFGEGILWHYWAKMQSKDWADGAIAYRDDYSITNVADLLLQLSTIFNNLKITPPTFIRTEWKRIIKEFDGKIAPATLEMINKEIDAMSDHELVDNYIMPGMPAGDTKASAAAPSTANLTQGIAQRTFGSDRAISLATGNRASTKEANADANKRTTVKVVKKPNKVKV